jgi:hypothetical protein
MDSDCAFKSMPYSDAARRCADIVNSVAIIENAVGNYNQRWVAIRLSDGGSDGETYASKADAVRHQLHESLCAYVLVPPTGMEAREAEIFLNFHRKAYDAGFRTTDPDDPDIIPPIANETIASQSRRLGK